MTNWQRDAKQNATLNCFADGGVERTRNIFLTSCWGYCIYWLILFKYTLLGIYFGLVSSLVKCIHTYEHVMTCSTDVCTYICSCCFWFSSCYPTSGWVGKGISHLSANGFTYHLTRAQRLLTTMLKIADKLYLHSSIRYLGLALEWTNYENY